jgi:hypothetical protein
VIATAWSNGQLPRRASTYGLRIRPADRKVHFRRSWRTVTVILSGPGVRNVARVNLSPSFWRTCPELRGRRIGSWLLKQGAAPWSKGRPPHFDVLPISGRRLLVVPLAKRKSRHADGTSCLEGTRSVPPRFRSCCEVFAGHTRACVNDIRYEWWSRSGRWVTVISETSGGGGIKMRYCPHCGARLRAQG